MSDYTKEEKQTIRTVRQINARRANDRISCIYCWDSWKTYRGWKNHMCTGRGLRACDRRVAENRRKMGLPAKNPAAVVLGTRGGKVKSAAKAKAAQENGKLGGRPKQARSKH